ncbi:Gypsy retrotransposon integrase-like protein 1-like 6, partial [Homarus americanus]
MYYIGKDGCEKRIVLYTDEQKQKVFDEYHILKSREHYDSAQTLYNLAERFYWTSMAEDVIAMGGSHHMVCELKRLKTPATIQRGSSSIKSNVTLKPECLPAGEIHNNFTNTTTSKAFLKSNYLPSSEKDNKLTSICDNIIHKSSTPVDVSGTRVQDTHLKGTLKVVDSYEEVLKLIIAEEKATGMHFVGHRKEGIFDRIGKVGRVCL